MYMRTCNGTAGGRRRHLVRRSPSVRRVGRKRPTSMQRRFDPLAGALPSSEWKRKKKKEKREAVRATPFVRSVSLWYSFRDFLSASSRRELGKTKPARESLALPPHAWYATLRLSDNALNYLNSATSSCTPYRACAWYSENILWFTRVGTSWLNWSWLWITG